MYARLTAFTVWALLAGSIVFWALKLGVSPLPAPSQALAAVDNAAARVDLSRLLGSTPVGDTTEAAAPVTDSRFQLLGLVAPKAGLGAGQGVALIAVDGKPGRAYRVGAAVEGDLSLLRVDLRSATLGVKGSADAAGQVVLQLPPLNVAVNAAITSPTTFDPSGTQPAPSASVVSLPPSLPLAHGAAAAPPPPPQEEPGHGAPTQQFSNQTANQAAR